MTQNVNFQGHDLESQGKSRSFVKVSNILQNFLHPTHEHICEVSLRSYWQFLWKTCAQFSESWPLEERKNIRRKSLTDVDTL